MYSKNYKKLCMLFVSVFLFVFLFTGTVFAAESGWISASGHHSDSRAYKEDHAYAQDDSYARFGAVKGGKHADRVYYSFGSSIVPANAIINGIEVRIDGYGTGNSFDLQLYAKVGGRIIPVGNAINSGALQSSDTDTYIVLGGPANNWGYADWAAAKINTTNFRVLIESTDSANYAYLDHIQVKVYYTVPANTAPVAANDSYKTHINEVLTVAAAGVLANDKDVDGNTLTSVKVTDPAHGTVTLNTNGSFIYAPALNYTGTDSFTYKASDSVLNSNIATVNIKVRSAKEQRVSTGASGGGWIEYPVSDNDKANFVFAVRFNKEQTVKGFFSITYRATEGGQTFVYKVRSNSWDNGGLVFTDDNEAYFYGDATYKKINATTDAVVQEDGSARFLVYFLDGNLEDPKAADKISIKVTLNNDSTTFMEVGTTSALVELGGGNINIHKGK